MMFMHQLIYDLSNSTLKNLKSDEKDYWAGPSISCMNLTKIWPQGMEHLQKHSLYEWFELQATQLDLEESPDESWNEFKAQTGILQWHAHPHVKINLVQPLCLDVLLEPCLAIDEVYREEGLGLLGCQFSHP